MTKISTEEVIRIAKLSRLSLSDTQVESLKSELSSIFELIDQLDAVDVSDFDITDQVSGLTTVARADVLQVLPSADELLEKAPNVTNRLYKVKRVLD